MAIVITTDARESAINAITRKGIPVSEANLILDDWLSGAQLDFAYKTPFPASDPHCKSNFQRSFHHTDWIDGTSIVQAGETTTELGFNRRLHQIESDLDSLHADIDTAFECLGEMRASIASLLAEIAAGFEAVSAAMRACCAARATGGGGSFVGTVEIGGQTVAVLEGSDGLEFVPSNFPKAPGGGGDPEGPVYNVNLTGSNAAKLAKLLAHNPAIDKTFTGGTFTKEQFIEKYGNKKTPDGTTVKQLLDALPSGSKFTGVGGVLEAVAEVDAAFARRTGSVEGIRRATFGSSQTTPAGNVSISNFTIVPSGAQAALTASGVKTVNDLAGAQVKALQKDLASKGVKATTDDVAGWVGAAIAVRAMG
jgi:hypothetical protein